jgi:prepilin-type N-terminal cleavage/methylation domain-containing protein
MIRRGLEKLHRGQGGFTLIEVLVVMTILGILAAVVSMSLLGVTASARTKARDTEKATVQAAFDAMLSDQQVPETDIASVCDPDIYTNNMQAFPGTAQYTGPGLLAPVGLANHYLRQPTTTFKYGCTVHGDVVQNGR